MSSYGVQATGFVAETFTQLVSDLNAAFKAAFGAGIDVTPTSVYGQIIQIMADRLADLWNADAGIYAAWTAEGATALSLDNLCALTGTVRNPATYSSVTCILAGTNATVVPAGSVLSVGANGARFALVGAAATITTQSAWAANHAYAAGAFATNSGNIYYTVLGGTSSNASPPTGTGHAIVDNTVTWYYVAAGSAAVAKPFQAVSPGAVIALSNTLTYIATPAAGWTSAQNPLDAALGRLVETDSALRLRRAAELHLGGAGTVDAIRSHVLTVPGVATCKVFDNPLDVVSADGIPAHAFETMVGGSGYDVAVLAQTIWTNKPAGIRAYGAIPVTTTDSQGNSQVVAYTTPTLRNTYIVCNLLVDSGIWNSSNIAAKTLAIQAALLAFGPATLITGKDVVASSLEAQCFQSGVLDATCNIGTAPAPVTRATISIGVRELAVLDSSRITINITYGVP